MSVYPGQVGTDPFSYQQYMVRKQFVKLFGGTFRVFAPNGSLALLADMKPFKFKEDIRVYTEEAKQNEVLVIKARSVLDFSASYDVWDSRTSEKLGALRRRGLKSMLKDEWVILDNLDQEIGLIEEDSWLMATLRRFATNLIPQSYGGTVKGMQAFTFKQHFNPFVLKIDLDFSSDINNLLDRRMGIAAAVLLCGVEGRQE